MGLRCTPTTVVILWLFVATAVFDHGILVQAAATTTATAEEKRNLVGGYYQKPKEAATTTIYHADHPPIPSHPIPYPTTPPIPYYVPETIYVDVPVPVPVPVETIVHGT